MIGSLRGVLTSSQPPWLCLDVAGVGYELQAPMTTIYQLPAVGEELRLFCHLWVREDAHKLYGFHCDSLRDVFRQLIKVNGVGPSLALAILSAMETDELIQIVQEGNVKRLTQIPGIGKKTAERLLVELRDKWQQEPVRFHQSAATTHGSSSASISHDALGALVALGFKSRDAQQVIEPLLEDEGLNREALIKRALKQLAAQD